MDSSVSPKDEIWPFARVPSHFNWPLQRTSWTNKTCKGAEERRDPHSSVKGCVFLFVLTGLSSMEALKYYKEL